MPPPDVPTNEDLNSTADAATKASHALDILSASTVKSGESLNNLGSFTEGAKNAFNSFNNMLSSYGVSVNSTKALTEQQTTQFGLLSAAVLGAKTSFNSLYNIDTTNLNTFTEQINYLTSTFTDAKSGIGQLVKFAQESFGKIVPQAVIEQGIGAVKSFVSNLSQSADNALRLQNAYIQLSSKTGNLSSVYAAAGPNLENLNILLEKQNAIINNAIKTTGLAPEAIQNYYTQLGTIPKALEATATSSQSASETLSMLTASIKLSSGTGRNYADIIDDMRVAFKNYNIIGEDALQFTARISEISNKFGTNLDVVRDSLISTANTFKMFGNEAEASTKILNQYVGALQHTGLSGDAAVDVVTSMTNAMSNLGIAQKSFLSAQTGGAGGLMGAFQIEKMMRDGKLDEVFEKIRSQMQKQFGKIVSLEDASSSPAAAAQMTKQMMILKQGPMGQFARTDQEAIRILEGFKAMQEGKVKPTDLSNRIVQENVDKGTLIQEKSYTELSRIRGILEGARGTADIANLGFMQRGMTAGMGTQAALSEAQRKSKENLSLFMTTTGVEGGAVTQDYARDIKTRAPVTDAAKRAVTSINEFTKLFSDIPLSMKAPIDALKQAIESGKTMNVEVELEDLKNEIEKAKLEASKKPKEERDRAMEIISKQENILKEYSSATVSAAINRSTRTNLVNIPIPSLNTATTTGENRGPTSQIASPHDINVHVTGYCIKCKQEIDNSAQAMSINPAGIRT